MEKHIQEQEAFIDMIKQLDNNGWEDFIHCIPNKTGVDVVRSKGKGKKRSLFEVIINYKGDGYDKETADAYLNGKKICRIIGRIKEQHVQKILAQTL